ncbi:MAG TPA: prepilin peptidase [Chthoniobacteraceae bacterium]|nr:prepilin peptidase [Chthoniobacteraceae bacterium]
MTVNTATPSLRAVLPLSYEILFAAFAFVLGSAIGSFLNVCIYRMPLGLSVNEPKRSFCPSCKYQIPWFRNLPLVSWLSLRGRCANCGSPIAVRYFGVELLTGLLFLAVWWRVWLQPRSEWDGQGWVLALPFWILVSLLIVATFIDFEHFIIPDEITWGGVAAGVVLSFAIPTMMETSSNLISAGWSLGGAAAGYLLLWGVVELGKKAFGKKQFKLAGPTAFTWTRKMVQTEQGEQSDADLVVGNVSWKEAAAEDANPPESAAPRGESWLWSETFWRDSDRLLVEATQVVVDGTEIPDGRFAFSLNQLESAGRTWQLEKVNVIRGIATSVVIPREAMGFGDVKFIAAIGAFLGWKAVLFTIMAGSTVGALVGLSTIALGKREWSMKIPFGPYLALGALVWMFFGPELVGWYMAFVTPPAGV